MQFLRDVPIRRKLLCVTLATCGAALAVACTALFWFQSLSFRKSFVAELQALGAVVAQNSAAPLMFEDTKSAVEVLSALKASPQITSALVFDAQGRLFARFGTEGNPRDAPEAQVEGQVTFDQGYAVLRLPVILPDAPPGRLQLRAQFQKKYRELLSLYAGVLAAVLAVSLVVIVLVSAAMQGIITRPIATLVEVARNVSEHQDYSMRAPEAGGDEVGVLTQKFNRMLEQIQSRDQRLRESQQRYEVAVMGSSDGLWDWDLVSKAVYFSPRWKSMLGYADAELSNSFETFRGLLHPEDVERVLAKVAAYLSGEEGSYEVEFRARCKDGEDRWILSRGAALRNQAGKPVRFAGSHTDITDRKQAEQEIRLARAKFESLVNSIHGIVWEADPETSHMLFVSNQAEAMLGYAQRLWVEDPHLWENSIHPEDRAPMIDGRKRELAAGNSYQVEFRMIAGDGQIVWLRESVSVVREGDRPARLRGLALDITKQKLAGEQIARMQRELVDTSRLAGMAEIATGVLHNVGNVLNNVNISSGLIVGQLRKSKTSSLALGVQLLREHKDNVGEFFTNDPRGQKLPAFFEAISEQLAREQAMLMKESQALQANIEHIKQVVAMQQAYATVSGAKEMLTARELVEDALRMGAVALSRHQVEVVHEFAAVPPVMVDRHKVLQILINLIANAKQALDSRTEGRRLVLSIACGESGRVCVAVRDNGIGIPSENLTRIFSHGFTTKKTGHGFGLHSGANAAKEMGGCLSVQSDGPGHGACFTLELPVSKNASQRPPPSANEPDPLLRRAAA